MPTVVKAKTHSPAAGDAGRHSPAPIFRAGFRSNVYRKCLSDE